MRALLDVSVLIALMDEDHVFHHRAHEWLAEQSKEGWASCPITENGLVRIMTNPGYHPVRRRSPGEVVQALKDFAENSDHEFWPDDVSLRNPASFDAGKILGSRQITDLYLLALAVKRAGRLITFDEGIHLAAVPEATPTHLRVLR